MQQTAKIVVVSQHYPPDHSTTAAIMASIADHLASEAPLLVLSGMPGSANQEAIGSGRPAVVEIKNRMGAKAALIRRATAEMFFTIRVFVALLGRLRSGDVVLTVTAPFMLPYAVAAAAMLKRARSVLIMHDLFPDVLVMAGLLKPSSLVATLIRGANALMFRMLSAVVIIGRDTEALLLRYKGLTRDRICFIPNWATLAPGVRPIDPDNPYRRAKARFIVGLSGNLGFTHDPDIVFEAARLLRDNPDIHFMLSGWGIGFDRLKAMQSAAKLAECEFGRARSGTGSRGISFRCRCLADSLPQGSGRRVGTEPVLQSACDRPAGHSGFRGQCRGSADRDRAWHRLGGRAGQARRSRHRGPLGVRVGGFADARTRGDCFAAL